MTRENKQRGNQTMNARQNYSFYLSHIAIEVKVSGKSGIYSGWYVARDREVDETCLTWPQYL